MESINNLQGKLKRKKGNIYKSKPLQQTKTVRIPDFSVNKRKKKCPTKAKILYFAISRFLVM